MIRFEFRSHAGYSAIHFPPCFRFGLWPKGKWEPGVRCGFIALTFWRWDWCVMYYIGTPEGKP